jgi:tetratricopeptide (TPR) repeat protein
VNRERAITIAIAAACVVGALFVGRALGSRASAPQGSAVGADPAAAAMSAGLAATDAKEAVVHFRKALEINPDHYGANYQLASALDRAGQADEAQKQWQRVLELAQKSGDQPVVDAARRRIAGEPSGDPMAAGLDALYAKRDPRTAIVRFREVLAQNPQHYGATYQLATALEQAGDARGARPLWESALRMAEAIGDAQTATTARERIAAIDKQLTPAVDPDGEAMRAGLTALYDEKDTKAAIAHFERVLAHNPEHYGASYQLATALDRAGKAADARPRWEKVLRMAEAINDEATAKAARARLAQKP